MNLSYTEIEEYLELITTGAKVVDIDNVVIIFKYPSVRTRMMARRVQKLEYDLALKEGMLSNSQMKDLIEERNLITDSDRSKLKKIESQLEAQNVLLAKTTRVKARQDRVKGIILDLNKKKAAIEYKERSKYAMTAETRAEESKILYMCWASTYTLDDELYWNTREDFIKENDYLFRQTMLSEFMTFYTGIPTSTIRAIARSNIWRIKYVTSTKLSEELFGVPVAKYTSDMLNLVYWSHFYQNINEMLPEDQPPDDIVEDDYALDAFMEDYHKERSQEIGDRKSRKGASSKLSSFDQQEVLVTRTNELYDDIDFDEPREAKALQDKGKTIVSKKARRR